VLIGERQPDDFKLLLVDDALEATGRFALFVRPEGVALDESQRATPSKALSNAADGEPGLSSLQAEKRRANRHSVTGDAWIASLRSQ
jgi:hypothetical protein